MGGNAVLSLTRNQAGVEIMGIRARCSFAQGSDVGQDQSRKVSVRVECKCEQKKPARQLTEAYATDCDRVGVEKRNLKVQLLGLGENYAYALSLKPRCSPPVPRGTDRL